MNCWHCNTQLIWGNDHDLDAEEDMQGDEFSMVTTLFCPKCNSMVEVYYPQERKTPMITLELPKKQVNAILVALDAEIEMQLGGRPVDWESFPEVAALLTSYYTTRCKFEEELEDD